MKLTQKPRVVACVGAGYVGALSTTVLALKNPDVTFWVYDKQETVISQWQRAAPPFFEPQHAEVLAQVSGKNLHFTADVLQALKEAEVIYIAVDTPSKQESADRSGTGGAAEEQEKLGMEADMRNFMAALGTVVKTGLECPLPVTRVLIEKSTVPVKTAQRMLAYIKEATGGLRSLADQNSRTLQHFEVLSVPEFLAEGSAIANLLEPDRVLVGHNRTPAGSLAYERVKSLYTPFIEESKILPMQTASSEIGKLLANAMLAQRISAINSISALCERVGGDILEVKRAVGSDKRIGSGHLNPSVGFGGSCFRKDVLSLIYILQSEGLHEAAQFWNATLKVNEWQKRRLSARVLAEVPPSATAITLLGLAYKKNTSDTRETPTVTVLAELLKNLGPRPCELRLYDPHVSEHSFLKQMFLQEPWLEPIYAFQYAKQVRFCPTLREALAGSSGVVVLTDETEFMKLDPEWLAEVLGKDPVVLDYRSIFNRRGGAFESAGVRLCSLGSAF